MTMTRPRMENKAPAVSAVETPAPALVVTMTTHTARLAALAD
jgi:hypothetical protein